MLKFCFWNQQKAADIFHAKGKTRSYPDGVTLEAALAHTRAYADAPDGMEEPELTAPKLESTKEAVVRVVVDDGTLVL